MGKNEIKVINHALGRTKTGVSSGNSLITCFGCNSCSWRDTTMCPHKLEYPNKHVSGICSERALYIKEVWAIAGNKTRWLQVEEATRLKLLLDKFTQDFNREGVLDPNVTKLSKNIINLLDKMRRQDEGLKISQDINVNLDDFKKTVEAQAKVIEVETEGDITKTEDEDE